MADEAKKHKCPACSAEWVEGLNGEKLAPFAPKKKESVFFGLDEEDEPKKEEAKTA